MIRRLLVLVLVASLPCVPPAHAQVSITPVVLGAHDPVTVRRDLVAFAGRITRADSIVAAEAWTLTGESFHRDGMADSAIACWQTSLAHHLDGDTMDQLIEALLTRHAGDDVSAARAWIPRRFQLLRFEGNEWDQPNTQGRIAWSLFLAGKPDTALKVFQRARRLLDDGNPMRWVWRRRIAETAQAAGDRDRALEMCKDLATRSLLQDRDALALLHRVLGGSQGDERFAPFLRTELLRAQQEDQDRLERVGAQRLQAKTTDGFVLSGVCFRAPVRTRRAVVAIASAEDDFTRYDSLAAGLARAGLALVVMDPRGSGRSLGPSCANPESWNGRENEMEHVTATDVKAMFNAFARVARLDSTAYLVLGTANSTPIAVEAATLDPRVKAVLLLSPMPPTVELGRMAARLASHKTPTFFETAPSDVGAAEVAAELYDSVDSRTSRLVDSEATGRGPMVFRFDGTAMPRLTSWLRERFPARVAPRPAARHKG